MSKSKKSSANDYRDHLVVLSEDNANRRIVNGFLMAPGLDSRAIAALPFERGWKKVPKSFRNYVNSMCRFPNRRVLLLIDFDVNETDEEKRRIKIEKRLTEVRKYIPEKLIKNDRVFVLGVLDEPEDLIRASNNLNTFEKIGEALAQDCFKGTDHAWRHDLLIHNKDELARMEKAVKPFLFTNANNS